MSNIPLRISPHSNLSTHSSSIREHEVGNWVCLTCSRDRRRRLGNARVRAHRLNQNENLTAKGVTLGAFR